MRNTLGATKLVTTLVVLLSLLASSGCGAIGGDSGKRFVAMFRTAIGVYPSADVRVLGVPVGKVDKVIPQGELVRLEFHVDGGVQVPAEAKAVVVAPTVVADRYVQLTPVYTGGPTLADGAVIPAERTASPAEFDDLLAAAQKLSKSLGPEGANASGALSQALTAAARNLQGNGEAINKTLDNTSRAITTLSANRENLAATVQNLQSFTTNLKKDDGQVREFTRQFAQVNGFLAGERQNLGETLKELSEALGDVAHFVRDNRKEIRSNVEQLSDVLRSVNNERIALEQVLETAPAGLDGLVNSYDAATTGLATRADLLGVLFCLLGSQLNNAVPGLGTLILTLAQAAFPGNFDPIATCSPLSPGGGAAGSSPVPLSPQTKAQLTSPQFAASMGQLAKALSARAAARPPAGGPGPGVGSVTTSEPASRKTLGELLGGGR